MLRSKDTDLRKRAARLLGVIRDGTALGPLIEALRDPDPWVRVEAVQALGAWGDVRAFDAVERVLEASMEARRERTWDVREDEVGAVAVFTLARLGGPRASELLAGLVDTLGGTGLAAAEMLAYMGDRRAVPRLVACLESQMDNLWQHTAEALETLLGGSADDLSREDLEAVAGLPDERVRLGVNSGIGPGWYCSGSPTVRVDCSRLKTLAREETARRGMP
jgi:HEAT repeat protein